MEGSGEQGPLNVGTGVETSVLELVERVRETFGRDDFEPEFAPQRAGEVERTYLDTRACAERLGWRAERTIETGLAETRAADG
jgi:UDP-glucose 4-epimerase